MEGRAIARPDLEGRTIGFRSLFEPRRPGLPIAERLESGAKIVLRRRPVERRRSARQLLQRRTERLRRIFEFARPAFPLAERQQSRTQIVLRRRPGDRNPLARQLFERGAIGAHSISEPRRSTLSLAERLKHIAEIGLGVRPRERGFGSRVLRQRAPTNLDGLAQRIVVAALAAFSVERISLPEKIAASLLFVIARNIAGCLAKQPRGLVEFAFGQGHIALGRCRARGAEPLRVLRRLRPLPDPARLLRGGDLSLSRLPQQFVRLLKVSRLNFALGLVYERSRVRIARVQRRDLCLQPPVILRCFCQRLRQFVLGNVGVVAHDPQEVLRRAFRESKRPADLVHMLLLRVGCAPHRRLGQLPKLFGREAKIAGDRVADRAARDRDAALTRVDLGVGESELGLKSKNCETEGERRTTGSEVASAAGSEATGLSAAASLLCP